MNWYKGQLDKYAAAGLGGVPDGFLVYVYDHADEYLSWFERYANSPAAEVPLPKGFYVVKERGYFYSVVAPGEAKWKIVPNEPGMHIARKLAVIRIRYLINSFLKEEVAV